MTEMRLKKRDGSETTLEPTAEEFAALVNASLDSIRRRSSIVECAECGQRFLVNNQDFHQVTRCPVHSLGDS